MTAASRADTQCADIQLDSDRLAELIGYKLRLLERLVELSRQQEALIGRDEMDSLFALLSSKQRLIEGVRQVEQAIDPFRAQDPETRSWRSPADRAKCRTAAERCELLLGELLASEQRAAGEMETRRRQTETRMQEFDSAARAQAAYVQSGPQTARLDLSSS